MIFLRFVHLTLQINIHWSPVLPTVNERGKNEQMPLSVAASCSSLKDSAERCQPKGIKF
jgi:hypothetical protein